MTRYRLAERLRKTRSEIDAMPVDEFAEWIAYFKIIATEKRGLR